MQNKLREHAQIIIQQTETLINDSGPLNESQLRYLERVNRNTVEFLDTYERLHQMPLREVVSILNHDTRNLITPIVGYAELLEMQAIGSLNDQQVLLVKSLCLSSRHLRDELDVWINEIKSERDKIDDPPPDNP